MNQGEKVRVVYQKHLLHGVIGRVAKVKTYRDQTRVLVSFGNFESVIDVSHLRAVSR